MLADCVLVSIITRAFYTYTHKINSPKFYGYFFTPNITKNFMDDIKMNYVLNQYDQNKLILISVGKLLLHLNHVYIKTDKVIDKTSVLCVDIKTGCTVTLPDTQLVCSVTQVDVMKLRITQPPTN